MQGLNELTFPTCLFESLVHPMSRCGLIILHVWCIWCNLCLLFSITPLSTLIKNPTHSVPLLHWEVNSKAYSLEQQNSALGICCRHKSFKNAFVNLRHKDNIYPITNRLIIRSNLIMWLKLVLKCNVTWYRLVRSHDTDW